MKRLLSLFVVLAMLMSFGMVLTACQNGGGKDTETEPETIGDPTRDPTVMPHVYANTLSAFLPDDRASTVLKAAILKGSIDIKIAMEGEDGSPFGLQETVYTDSIGGKLVFDTLLSLAGEKMSATVWNDRAGSLTLSSEALLGSKNAYTANLDTLTSGLKDSALADMLGLSDKDVEQILQLMENLKASLVPDPAKPGYTKWQEKLAALVPMTAETQTEIGADGEAETEYLIVTYTINNDTLKGLIDLIGDIAVDLVGDMATDAEAGSLRDSLAEVKTQLDEALSIHMMEKVYILTEKKVVETCEVTFSILPKAPYESENGTITDYGTDELSGRITVTFSPDNITLDGEITTKDNDVGDETIKATATVDKKVEGDITTYTAHISGGTKNVTADLVNATLTYNKTTGALALAGDFMVDETDRMDFNLVASYIVTASELSFALQSVTVDKETVSFTDGKNELSLSVKVGTEAPALPADAKDIVTLPERELSALLSVLRESPMGQWFGQGGDINGDDHDNGNGNGAMPDSPLHAEIAVHHFGNEFRLGISQDFHTVEVEGYTGAYEAGEAAVLVLRESKTDCATAGITTLSEYVSAVMKNSDVSERELKNQYGVPYFEATSSGITVLSVMYETEDAFWLISLAAPEKSYGAYRADFLSYVEYLPTLNRN